MKSNLIFTLLIASILFMLSSCKSSKPTALTTSNPALANAPVIIYKTKADYFLHVPVNMTQDRKSLSSYPAPGDVFYAGDLALPVQLEDGYLLDRRGINELSAFTKWTYYEYSRLPNTPSQAEIMNMLLDTDPFTEIYFCGKRGDFNNLVEDLNKIIKKGKLSNFQRVK
jgi:hypothetical protein